MFTSAFTPAFRPLFRSAEEEQSYIEKVKSIFGTSLIAYWPLNEASGAVANDVSGNGYHGAYTGVDLGQTGIGDGETAPYFDGANDYVNIYSAGLASAFNGSEGTLMIWAKVANAGVWTDGVNRRLVSLTVDSNNRICIDRSSADNKLYAFYRAGGIYKGFGNTGVFLGYETIVITWDKVADEYKCFFKGSQLGATETGLGVFSGTLSSRLTSIGSSSGTAASLVYHGNLAHCAIGNTALTPAQIAELAVIP